MARIAGVNIPDDKRVEVALTYIHGIGITLSRKILINVKIDINKKVKELTEIEINKIRDEISSKYQVEGDLSREISGNIKRLKEIGSYRGIRHKLNLPLRGQRTKTNARTKRGKKVTVGSGKKAISKT